MMESEATPGTRVVMRGPLATPGVICVVNAWSKETHGNDVYVFFDDGVRQWLDPRVLDAEPKPADATALFFSTLRAMNPDKKLSAAIDRAEKAVTK